MNVRHDIIGEDGMKKLWMLVYFIRHYPAYVFFYFMNETLLVLPSYVGNVLFLKYLMQALLHGDSVYRMLLLLGGTAFFLIASDVYCAWFSGSYMPCAEERIRKDFDVQMKEAVTRCGLEVYDNPSFYDDMTYINDNIGKDSFTVLLCVSKITAGIINISLIIHLFYEMGPSLLLFSIGAVVISFVFDIPIISLQNKKKYMVSGIERKRKYFRDCFFQRETFQERKMTNVNSLLYSRYEESVEEQILYEKKYGGKLFLFGSLKELLSTHLLMQLLLIAYLLYQVLEARTLLGNDFIAAYNGINVVTSHMMLIVKYWGQMASASYTVGKYRSFLSLVPREAAGIGEGECRGEIHSIELRNVSFSYPGTSKYVLKGIHFRLHSGEKVAIVGRNGSGKTTLVHLLLGLYVPTEGEILVNGKVLDRKDIPSYRRRFAVFFQGMKPMEATVAENIALDTEIDSERISLALRDTDCKALSFRPEKTMIGVQFDPTGLILSGGEYQKLMLAHCFYSDRPILVMDEPSSALDPVSERRFNEQVAELSGGKLTVFVTHRLSTVRMADTIYVIDDGRVCGKGNHEELVREEGVYRDMWEIQVGKW